MDRFIVIAIIAVAKLLGHLKSNMDRFIDPRQFERKDRMEI